MLVVGNLFLFDHVLMNTVSRHVPDVDSILVTVTVIVHIAHRYHLLVLQKPLFVFAFDPGTSGGKKRKYVVRTE